MKIYSIFDDFDKDSISILKEAGIVLTVHTLGEPRPNELQMTSILHEYDGVIIGTSQKITSDMFRGITSHKIIATASVGVDHINVPDEKKSLITIYNTPNANAQSVAEYTIGAALNCIKRISEGADIYLKGKNNKFLSSKPEDLYGKTIGVIGAGNISRKIMQYAAMFGMRVIYWTAHPEKHSLPYTYMPLDVIMEESDVISVNLPNNEGTKGIISKDLISAMKKSCIFISISRLDTIDIDSLIHRAQAEDNFYVNLDIDIDARVVNMIQDKKNVYITPHIAGGTVETRKRMFNEVSRQIVRGMMCIV